MEKKILIRCQYFHAFAMIIVSQSVVVRAFFLFSFCSPLLLAFLFDSFQLFFVFTFFFIFACVHNLNEIQEQVMDEMSFSQSISSRSFFFRVSLFAFIFFHFGFLISFDIIYNNFFDDRMYTIFLFRNISHAFFRYSLYCHCLFFDFRMDFLNNFFSFVISIDCFGFS